MIMVGIIVIAFALDAIFGDPYCIPHPICLIGKLISKGEKALRKCFYGSEKKAQSLVNKFAGTGQWFPPNKERINFGQIIGSYVDRKTGKSYKTTMGTIHYSKTGTHIVPAKPENWED